MIRISNVFRYYLGICVLAFLLASCGSGSGSTSTSSVTTITYAGFNCPDQSTVSPPGISGISLVGLTGSPYYITGVYVGSQDSLLHAFLYKGAITGGGTCTDFQYPSSAGETVTNTYLYGVDSALLSGVTLVGSYTTEQSGTTTQFGLLYKGAESGTTVGGYSTLNPSSISAINVLSTVATSVDRDIVVGNYTTDLGSGNAFIYNIESYAYYSLIGSGAIGENINAYGVLGDAESDEYTIVGSYNDASTGGVNVGFMIDWNSVTLKFSNFTTFSYNNLSSTQVATSFSGIASDPNGGYVLSGNWQTIGQTTTSPFMVNIKRNSNGSFGTPTWTSLGSYPGASLTIANALIAGQLFSGNIYVLGYYQQGSPALDYGYFATVNQSPPL